MYKPESTVKLNVGGKSFTTFYKTLEQSKFFVNLLNEDTLSSKTITNKNEIFIDRSGKLFSDILYYLRTHSVFANEEEAKYYQLDEMVEASKQEMKALSEIDKQKTSFVIKNVDTLKGTQDRSNYIVLEEEARQFRVYKICDVMTVPVKCLTHGYYCCTNCNRFVISKMLLHPTNKQLL
ncbi:hypothetical protein MBANPS3_000888 [Mucor bainieri]